MADCDGDCDAWMIVMTIVMLDDCRDCDAWMIVTAIVMHG
jgi:hypothetical protein